MRGSLLICYRPNLLSSPPGMMLTTSLGEWLWVVNLQNTSGKCVVLNCLRSNYSLMVLSRSSKLAFVHVVIDRCLASTSRKSGHM